MSTDFNDILNSSMQLGGGYINPKDILEYVSEEEIFQLVFGFLPIEHEMVVSPFREDNSPGCYFERSFNGKLRFKDFANNKKYRNIKLRNIDCFDAIIIYFKLNNLYEALELIKQKLILNGKLTKRVINTPFKENRQRSKIFISTREFQIKDGDFWWPYGVSVDNLHEDLVYPVDNYHITNTKKGDLSFSAPFFTYCYTDFISGNKKIYSPFKKEKGKFVTDCTENDIGGLRTLRKEGKKLIITKSYKDYRVLKNIGSNVIWFQSESMCPSLDILLNIVKDYQEVIIFFDNDEIGITNSKNVSDTINIFQPNKARQLFLPKDLLKQKIKDPSDFRKSFGNKEFIQMLSYYNAL